MIVAAAAFWSTILSLPLLMKALHRLQVLDVPNERSLHRASIVRGGGLGIITGLVVGVAAAVALGQETGRESWIALAACLGFAMLGFADDLVSLSPVLRLCGQLALSVAACLALFLGSARPAWTVLIVIASSLAVVAYVNAFNFMDGINAISAISCLVAAAWYAYLGTRLDASTLLVLGVALAGAALGFLPWNAPKAKVFLGDVGSYAIGAVLALMVVIVASSGAFLEALAPLVIYLADTGWTLVQRARRGENVFQAHREHGFQRLAQLGMTHVQVSMLVGCASGLTCLIVLALPTTGAVAALVVTASTYLSLPRMFAHGRPA